MLLERELGVGGHPSGELENLIRSARDRREQALALCSIEVSLQSEFTPKLIDPSLLVFTIGTVFGVRLLVYHPDSHGLEVEFFETRVHLQCHRRAGRERGRQQLVGRRPEVAAAD